MLRVIYKQRNAGQDIILATMAIPTKDDIAPIHRALVVMEFIVEEWCHIPPIEFQTLVEAMPRCIEAVLDPGGPTPY